MVVGVVGHNRFIVFYFNHTNEVGRFRVEILKKGCVLWEICSRSTKCDIFQPALHESDSGLHTVCFLYRWPQTKCRVTFDTSFSYSFYALSHGTLSFALHGSFFNHFLIGGDSSTANQIP